MIAQTHSNKKKYGELRRNSRAAYDSRLNWDAWGIAVNRLVCDVLGYGETPAAAETTVAGPVPAGDSLRTMLRSNPATRRLLQRTTQSARQKSSGEAISSGPRNPALFNDVIANLIVRKCNLIRNQK